MGGVLDASLSMPAVIFTVMGAVAAALWLISLLGVVDVDSVGDNLDGVFARVGLSEVPAVVVLTVVAIFGWAVSVLTQIYLFDRFDGATLTVLTVLLAVVAFAIAVTIAGVVGPKIGRTLEPTMAFRSADLVGRTAEIRSSTVTVESGYADARLADGTTSRVSIRTQEASAQFRSGDVVVLVHYEPDDDAYLIDELPPELAS